MNFKIYYHLVKKTRIKNNGKFLQLTNKNAE